MGLPRTLTYEPEGGRLHFAWLITATEIEVFEVAKTGVPLRRLGMLTARDEDGHVVEFEQDAFEAQCDRFIRVAGEAEVRDESEPEGG